MIDRYNEICKQIKELEKEKAKLEKELEKNYTSDFYPNVGFYYKNAKGDFLVCYINYYTREIYTKGLLYNSKGKKIGHPTTKAQLLGHIENLKNSGFTLIN